jgi:hypothetical protein
MKTALMTLAKIILAVLSVAVLGPVGCLVGFWLTDDE